MLSAQTPDSLPFTWLQEFADSLLNTTTLCQDCLTKPTFQQFVTPSGETQFRYNFSCAPDFATSAIYNLDGTILALCYVNGDERACESDISSAFTGFTFGTDVRVIWTCSSGFDCQSQNELKLFEPYEILEDRISCDRPDRRLTTSRPFFNYTWITPDGDSINGTQIVARASGDYTLIVGDNKGCQDTTEIPFDIAKYNISLSGSMLICDDTGTLLSTSGYQSYQWSTGSRDSFYRFDQSGMYHLTTIDPLGCTDTIEFNIGDLSRRQVNIVPSRNPVFIGQSFTLGLELKEYNEDQIKTISWQLSNGQASCSDCIDPSITLSEDVTIDVNIIDLDGCHQSDQIELSPLLAYKKSYTGNIFSPNQDGKNDLFYLRSIPETIVVNQFSIYDRWGNQVHHASQHGIDEASAGWDGTYRDNEAPSGAYTWLAELQYSDGTSEIIHGSVFLIR